MQPPKRQEGQQLVATLNEKMEVSWSWETSGGRVVTVPPGSRKSGLQLRLKYAFAEEKQLAAADVSALHMSELDVWRIEMMLRCVRQSHPRQAVAELMALFARPTSSETWPAVLRSLLSLSLTSLPPHPPSVAQLVFFLIETDPDVKQGTDAFKRRLAVVARIVKALASQRYLMTVLCNKPVLAPPTEHKRRPGTTTTSTTALLQPFSTVAKQTEALVSIERVVATQPHRRTDMGFLATLLVAYRLLNDPRVGAVFYLWREQFRLPQLGDLTSTSLPRSAEALALLWAPCFGEDEIRAVAEEPVPWWCTAQEQQRDVVPQHGSPVPAQPEWLRMASGEWSFEWSLLEVDGTPRPLFPTSLVTQASTWAVLFGQSPVARDQAWATHRALVTDASSLLCTTHESASPSAAAAKIASLCKPGVALGEDAFGNKTSWRRIAEVMLTSLQKTWFGWARHTPVPWTERNTTTAHQTATPDVVYLQNASDVLLASMSFDAIFLPQMASDDRKRLFSDPVQEDLSELRRWFSGSASRPHQDDGKRHPHVLHGIETVLRVCKAALERPIQVSETVTVRYSTCSDTWLLVRREKMRFSRTELRTRDLLDMYPERTTEEETVADSEEEATEGEDVSEEQKVSRSARRRQSSRKRKSWVSSLDLPLPFHSHDVRAPPRMRPLRRSDNQTLADVLLGPFADTWTPFLPPLDGYPRDPLVRAEWQSDEFGDMEVYESVLVAARALVCFSLRGRQALEFVSSDVLRISSNDVLAHDRVRVEVTFDAYSKTWYLVRDPSHGGGSHESGTLVFTLPECPPTTAQCHSFLGIVATRPVNDTDALPDSRPLSDPPTLWSSTTTGASLDLQTQYLQKQPLVLRLHALMSSDADEGHTELFMPSSVIQVSSTSTIPRSPSPVVTRPLTPTRSSIDHKLDRLLVLNASGRKTPTQPSPPPPPPPLLPPQALPQSSIHQRTRTARCLRLRSSVSSTSLPIWSRALLDELARAINSLLDANKERLQAWSRTLARLAIDTSLHADSPSRTQPARYLWLGYLMIPDGSLESSLVSVLALLLRSGLLQEHSHVRCAYTIGARVPPLILSQLAARLAQPDAALLPPESYLKHLLSALQAEYAGKASGLCAALSTATRYAASRLRALAREGGCGQTPHLLSLEDTVIARKGIEVELWAVYNIMTAGMDLLVPETRAASFPHSLLYAQWRIGPCVSASALMRAAHILDSRFPLTRTLADATEQKVRSCNVQTLLQSCIPEVGWKREWTSVVSWSLEVERKHAGGVWYGAPPPPASEEDMRPATISAMHRHHVMLLLAWHTSEVLPTRSPAEPTPLPPAATTAVAAEPQQVLPKELQQAVLMTGRTMQRRAVVSTPKAKSVPQAAMRPINARKLLVVTRTPEPWTDTLYRLRHVLRYVVYTSATDIAVLWNGAPGPSSAKATSPLVVYKDVDVVVVSYDLLTTLDKEGNGTLQEQEWERVVFDSPRVEYVDRFSRNTQVLESLRFRRGRWVVQPDTCMPALTALRLRHDLQLTGFGALLETGGPRRLISRMVASHAWQW